jgi:hypothetical protein
MFVTRAGPIKVGAARVRSCLASRQVASTSRLAG